MDTTKEVVCTQENLLRVHLLYPVKKHKENNTSVLQ